MALFEVLTLAMAIYGSWLVAATPQQQFVSNINITYCVENNLTDVNPKFQMCIQLDVAQTYLYDVMIEAKNNDNRFRFDGSVFPPYGFFVSTINELKDNRDKQLFWAFMRENDAGGRCLLNVGVSSYVPKNGETIVFSYQPYEVFNYTASCTP